MGEGLPYDEHSDCKADHGRLGVRHGDLNPEFLTTRASTTAAMTKTAGGGARPSGRCGDLELEIDMSYDEGKLYPSEPGKQSVVLTARVDSA